MSAYYNEIDEYAAQWLRNLISAGHIADGEVDTRSISDVRPDDVRGFTQCHFFAGIGGWSLALRLAGWADDEPVWTGSCPCQPFSVAGSQSGFADERHLWPDWFHLIGECRPPVVFGEQVEAAIRLGWLDLVQTDLEGLGYAVGKSGLPAACVGAPHIRQRLWFVGHASGTRVERHTGAALGARACGGGSRRADGVNGSDASLAAGTTGLVADSSSTRLERRDGREVGRERTALERGGGIGALADDDDDKAGRSVEWLTGVRRTELHDADGRGPQFAADHQSVGRGEGLRHVEERPGLAEYSAWGDVIWLPCRDGKSRPTQPGIQPLAHGVPARVGKLRAAGNAIVPQVAAAFIEEAMRCRP